MTSEPSTKGPERSVQIGKYTVLVHLATGGMGAVYKAFDTETKRDVALKVLTPELASKPLMIERFRREAKHAKKLRHENIVELYNFEQAGGQYFLVMEFIEGVDLQDYVDRKGMLDLEEAASHHRAGRPKALDHAQRSGHRPPRRSSRPTSSSPAPQGVTFARQDDRLRPVRARSNSEEFRVTRKWAPPSAPSITFPPEQARDSGQADMPQRPLLVGCSGTISLLSGKAPFPEGGLAERLNKHRHRGLDVRLLNPPRGPPPPCCVAQGLSVPPTATRRRSTSSRTSRPSRTAVRRPDAALQLGLLNDDGDASAYARIPSAKTKAAKSGPCCSPGGKAKKATGFGPARRPVSRARLWYILGGAAAALFVAVAVGRGAATPPFFLQYGSGTAHSTPLFYAGVGNTPRPDPARRGGRRTNRRRTNRRLPRLAGRWTEPQHLDAVALRNEVEGAPGPHLPYRRPTPPFSSRRPRALPFPSPGVGPLAYPSLAAAAAAAPPGQPSRKSISTTARS